MMFLGPGIMYLTIGLFYTYGIKKLQKSPHPFALQIGRALLYTSIFMNVSWLLSWFIPFINPAYTVAIGTIYAGWTGMKMASKLANGNF